MPVFFSRHTTWLLFLLSLLVVEAVGAEPHDWRAEDTQVKQDFVRMVESMPDQQLLAISRQSYDFFVSVKAGKLMKLTEIEVLARGQSLAKVELTDNDWRALKAGGILPLRVIWPAGAAHLGIVLRGLDLHGRQVERVSTPPLQVVRRHQFLHLQIKDSSRSLRPDATVQVRSLQEQSADDRYALFLGMATYFYYKERYFDGLFWLTAAVRFMPAVPASAALLRASLLVDVGLDEEAEAIVRSLNLSPGQNQEQLLLMEIWARSVKHHPERASAFLRRARSFVSTLEDPQREYFLYLYCDTYHRASGKLDSLCGRDWDSDSFWYGLASFNSRARRASNDHQSARAMQNFVLPELRDGEFETLLADKLNVSLGYYWLRQGRAEKAARHLSQIQLDGPYSNKALLGYGWAKLSTGDVEQAISPWLTLIERNDQDLYVQEAKIALAYAYTKMGRQTQALAVYENFIRQHEAEKRRLDEVLQAAGERRLFDFFFHTPDLNDESVSRLLLNEKDNVLFQIRADFLMDKNNQHLMRQLYDWLQIQRLYSDWSDAADEGEQIQAWLVKLETSRSFVISVYHELMDQLEQNLSRTTEKRRNHVLSYLSQTKYARAQLLDEMANEAP